MRILVGCEFSATVRDEFRKLGHDAWSCDLLPCERGPEWHVQDNVLNLLDDGWDMAVFHPPCTHLAVSGARWFKNKQIEQAEALEFVRLLLSAPIHRIALENPVSIISSRIRKPDQIIQPWQFGDPIMKKTCLWLKNLPPLNPTNIVSPTHCLGTNSYRGGPRKDGTRRRTTLKLMYGDSRRRSKTQTGIAVAMAEQWGGDRNAQHHVICSLTKGTEASK